MRVNGKSLIHQGIILLVMLLSVGTIFGKVQADQPTPPPEELPDDVWVQVNPDGTTTYQKSETHLQPQSTGTEWIHARDFIVRVYEFDPYCDVTIDIPALGISEVISTWDNGEGYLYIGNYGTLTAGMVVTASGCEATKELTIPNSGIDTINQGTRIVTGHGPASDSVYVEAHGLGSENASTTVSINSSGNWTANFSSQLSSVLWVNATTTDSDGDQFMAEWYIPEVKAELNSKNLTFTGFLPYSTLNITVPDLSIVDTITVDSEGNGTYITTGNLGSGMTVTASDSMTAKTLDVSNIAITNVDQDTFIVSGYGPANSKMYVCVSEWGGGWCDLPMTDDSGHWTSDFTWATLLPFPLSTIREAWVEFDDPDKDVTESRWDGPPYSPWLLTPVNQERTGDDTPTFQWAAVTFATKYTFEVKRVSDNSTVSKATYNASARCDDATCSIPSPVVFSPGFYKWHVVAYNGNVIGNWSSYNTFMLVGLDTPQLRSPGIDAIVYGGRPTFKWYPVTGATLYDLELYGTDALLKDSWTKSLASCGIVYCEFRLPYDLGSNYGDYQWRVRARSEDDESLWSATRMFSYTQLDRTVLISPEDGHITSDSTPTLQWADITGATMYLVEFRLPDDTFVRNVLVSDTTYCDGSTCTWDVDPALSVGDYKWHVRSKNGRNFGRWTGYRTITITSD